MYYNRYFREYQEATEKSERTIEEYAKVINDFQHFTCKGDEEVTKMDAISYVNSIKHLSTATVAMRIATLKSYYKFLNKNLEVAKDVFESVEAPTIKSREKEYLSAEEIKALIDNCPTLRDKALVTLCMSTGLRFSEATAITMDDYLDALDSGENSIKIIGKGSKERRVFLTDNCIKAINDYMVTKTVQSMSQGLLFSAESGAPLANNYSNLMLKKAAEKAGIKFDISFHWLRAFFASYLNECGIDVPTIANLMGHSNYSTTLHYVKISNDKKIEATNIMNF